MIDMVYNIQPFLVASIVASTVFLILSFSLASMVASATRSSSSIRRFLLSDYNIQPFLVLPMMAPTLFLRLLRLFVAHEGGRSQPTKTAMLAMTVSLSAVAMVAAKAGQEDWKLKPRSKLVLPQSALLLLRRDCIIQPTMTAMQAMTVSESAMAMVEAKAGQED